MDKSILLTIGKLARISRRIGDRQLASVGINTSWFRFIGCVAAEGPICQKDLQEEFGMSRATVSQHVNSLIDKGYLRTEVSAADRRQQMITVTEKGRAVYEAAIDCMCRVEALLADEISAGELASFRSCAEKMMRMLEYAEGSAFESQGV